MTFLEDVEGAVDYNQPENSDLDLWTIKETGNFDLGKASNSGMHRIQQSATREWFSLSFWQSERFYIELHVLVSVVESCLHLNHILNLKHAKLQSIKLNTT